MNFAESLTSQAHTQFAGKIDEEGRMRITFRSQADKSNQKVLYDVIMKMRISWITLAFIFFMLRTALVKTRHKIICSKTVHDL